MTVNMAVGQKTVKVRVPYHPEFPDRARLLGGKWDGALWTFDVRDKERVADLCMTTYGEDGLGNKAETVDVRIKLTLDDLTVAEYWRFGRCLLKRQGRDSDVRVGEGVVVLSGSFAGSGGSARYPRIAEYGIAAKEAAGWELEIRDVPANLLSGEYEIVPRPKEELSVTDPLTLEGQVGQVLTGWAVEDGQIVLEFKEARFIFRAEGYNDIEVTVQAQQRTE